MFSQNNGVNLINNCNQNNNLNQNTQSFNNQDNRIFMQPAQINLNSQNQGLSVLQSIPSSFMVQSQNGINQGTFMVQSQNGINQGTFMQQAYNGIIQSNLFNGQQSSTLNQQYSDFKSSSINNVDNKFKQFKQSINQDDINSHFINAQNKDKMEIEECFLQKQMQHIISDAIRDSNQFKP